MFVTAYSVVVLALSEGLAGERSRLVAVVVGLAVVVATEPSSTSCPAAAGAPARGGAQRPAGRAGSVASSEQAGGDAEVFERVATAVAEAVRSPGVALAVQRGSDLEQVAAVGGQVGPGLGIPLVHRGERLGEIVIAERTPGEAFSRTDRALLSELAEQASALLYGIRRDRELAGLRRNALETALAERAQLGRDLHDGLAPLLAGAGLTAEALRRDLAPGAAGEQEAAKLSERLRHAASQVREIAPASTPES